MALLLLAIIQQVISFVERTAAQNKAKPHSHKHRRAHAICQYVMRSPHEHIFRRSVDKTGATCNVYVVCTFRKLEMRGCLHMQFISTELHKQISTVTIIIAPVTTTTTISDLLALSSHAFINYDAATM